MSFENVWLIPLYTSICSIAAFFLSYVIALYNDHVMALWPYISDGGAMPPESCIFSQLLNLAALFLGATVYLRHRQIVEFYWHKFKLVGKWRAVSQALLWVGYTSAFGISVVANFQETNVVFVHYFGALLAFGCGLVYAWAQTAFSYHMNPKLARPLVSHCRLALCICSTVFFFMMVIFGPVLGHQPKKLKTDEEEIGCKQLYKWSGNEVNYAEHTVGTISEWALAICFQLYILSFVIELRHAYCHAPKLKLIAFCDEDSETGMAITEATMDMQRKLSRKGIRCVSVPTVVPCAIKHELVQDFLVKSDGEVSHAIRNSNSASDAVQIWIHMPVQDGRLCRLRRNQSDANLLSKRFEKANFPKKRKTISHVPTMVVGCGNSLRDSGFLDFSASNSTNDLIRSNSPNTFKNNYNNDENKDTQRQKQQEATENLPFTVSKHVETPLNLTYNGTNLNTTTTNLTTLPNFQPTTTNLATTLRTLPSASQTIERIPHETKCAEVSLTIECEDVERHGELT